MSDRNPEADVSSVVPYFRFTGRVGRDQVSATWSRGCLTADPDLFDRAQLLIAMKETFSLDNRGVEIHAGLDSPVAAALTLVRCFDQITKAEIRFFSQDQDAVSRIVDESVMQEPAD